MLSWIRNLDIRKVAVAIGFCMLIEKGIVDGDAPLADLGVSAGVVAHIVGYCKFLLWINGIVLVAHPMTAVRWPTPQNPAAAVKAVSALLIGSLALFGFSSAWAADLPHKTAPTITNPFLTNTSGWYLGAGSTASVQQDSVSGNNVFATSLVNGDLNAAGGTVDVVGGYIWSTPSFWGRVEASGSYENITAGSGTGGGSTVASRWAASQEFDVGFNFFQTVLQPVFQTTGLNIPFPTFSPNLPSNIAVAASPRQYVGAGLREFGISGTIGAASGTDVGVAPMLKTGYLWQTLGSNGQPNGGAIDAFAWVAFPVRGFTFNNVFAANGAPLTTGAGIDEGTQYGLGLHVLFGL